MAVHHRGVQESFQFQATLYVRPPDATHCLKCGYHNLLGYSQDTIKAKVKATIVPVVNGVLVPLGWQYIDVGVFGDKFEIYYKEASPAEPITTATIITILTLITIIIIGVVIAWCAWVYLETQREYAKAKQDKKQLLEEGKITKEQYTQLIEAQKPEEMLGGLGDIFKWIIIFMIIMAVAGALRK